MILLVDNYDSFSYNLYQYIGAVNPDITVIRNDELSVNQIIEMAPERIVISPGPGRPADAGICIELIQQMYDKVPMLGICLGHQALFEAFGGTVGYADKLIHGKASQVFVLEHDSIFSGLPPHFEAARYHSLAADKDTLPDELKVIAQTLSGEIMAVRHKDYPVFGLQFHPESILTPCGIGIIENFIGGEKV